MRIIKGIKKPTYGDDQLHPDDGEPPTTIIQYYENDVARAEVEAEAAILYHKRPVFQRAGMLVWPRWDLANASGGRKVKVTQFVRYNVKGLAHLFGKDNKDSGSGYKWVQFVQPEKKRGRPKDDAPLLERSELKKIAPPEKVFSYMIEIGHWKVPRVNGIINTPTLRPDGSLLAKQSYDEATELWLQWDDALKLPTMPERPTRDDALASLRLFEELLVEFPFVSDVDKAVALSAILTAVLRPAFPLAPIHYFRASEAGTGKSYLMDIVSTIATGRACPVITVADKEEMEKRLGALLLGGAQLIGLDNMSRNLDGDLLCQIATQLTIQVRILGKSETPECEFRGLVMATANNKHVAADLVRRVMVSNLYTEMERPELRDFHGDPIAAVLKDRGRYVAAAITLARAYLASGDKVKCSPFVTFGGWSRFVRESR